MYVRRRVILFASHIFGDAALKVLSDNSSLFEVPIVITDDPHQPFSNAANRLWRYGWDPSVASLVEKRANKVNVPVAKARVRNEAFKEQFRAFKPQGILVSVFGQRLPEELLDVVNGRAFNLHPVIPGEELAATRGPAPLVSAAMSGARQLQMAIHQMTPEFDAGKIVDRGKPIKLPLAFSNWMAKPTLHHREIQSVYHELSLTTVRLIDEQLNSLFPHV